MKYKIITKYFLATVIITALISCSKETVDPNITFNRNGLEVEKTIQHNGLERKYILYIPSTYTGTISVPLVLNIHGHGLTASKHMNYGDLRPIADSAGFIIVHPQATVMYGDTHWNVGSELYSDVDDIGFLDMLLNSIQRDFNIDSKRIYSAGYSNGARMSFLLGCKLNHRVAAVAGVAGLMSENNQIECSQAHHPTPVLQIHGTLDSIISYNDVGKFLDFWMSINNCDKNPVISYIPDNNPNDGSTTQHFVYKNKINGTTVEHFKVIGGGHSWPGYNGDSDINASVELWRFLSKYDINGLIE